MAIPLPPPVTPQQAPLQAVQAQGSRELLLDYHDIRIHLSGPLLERGGVEDERLRNGVAGADSLSDAVRMIGYLYYANGYPATLVSYAVAGKQDLYVRVVAGRVHAVHGPQRLAEYFDDLRDRPVLRDLDLESDRVLADALSERAGQDYKPQLKPDGSADGVVLDLGEPQDKGHRTAAAVDFSNYGNRYSGPYLADAAVRHSFASGDELSLGGATSVRLLGLGGSGSEPYHEGDLGWSRVTPYGVIGIQGRYADFRQDVQDSQGNAVRLDGKIGSGGLSWLLPLYSDFRSRLNLLSKADRNFESIGAGDAGGLLLSQGYNSVETGLSYVRRIQHNEQRFEWSVAVAVRKGLSRDYSGIAESNLGYFLWRPSFSLRYDLDAHWSFTGEGQAQLGGSTVPQLEQFVIGGPTSLHAYETGVGVGDRGEQFRISSGWKDDGDSWLARHKLRPSVFVEYGSTELAHPDVGEPAGRVDLADAGAELSLDLTHWLSGTLSAAQPFLHHGAGDSPDGLQRKSVFFQVSAKY